MFGTNCNVGFVFSLKYKGSENLMDLISPSWLIEHIDTGSFMVKQNFKFRRRCTCQM